MIRSFLLPLFAAGAMASVWLLPQSGSVAPSAIQLELPPDLAPWWRLQKIQPSEKEVAILAKDTDFSKALCIAPQPGRYQADGQPMRQRLDLSIVLSGSDINNSIHRPERCMPAQGHQIYQSTATLLKTPEGHQLPAKILRSLQTVQVGNPEEKRALQFNCVTFYFFVGQHSITNDHLKRTFIDMRDRILRGQDQRWAYVSASMWFDDTEANNLPTRESAEKQIRQLLESLADQNVDWSAVRRN
ncbi:MAG TPA: exosortase-associated EpsI family protein [Luteolibacter sp.]